MPQTHILKVSRLEGLTDGVFAIAMTILVLNLRLPIGILAANLPAIFVSTIFFNLLIYIGSFIILGTLWIAMNFQLGLLASVNRSYLWSNVFYLMIVCVVPFSASLIAEFPKSQWSLSFFAINLLFANLGQLLTFHYANKYNLNGELNTPAIAKAILHRIYVAPIFYIAALLLAFWNTSIAFLVLVAPPIIYMFPGQIDHLDKR